MTEVRFISENKITGNWMRTREYSDSQILFFFFHQLTLNTLRFAFLKIIYIILYYLYSNLLPSSSLIFLSQKIANQNTPGRVASFSFSQIGQCFNFSSKEKSEVDRADFKPV